MRRHPQSQILRDQGVTDAEDEPFKIEVRVNKAEHTLKFIDNGIGMDAEEVVKYIAQIAFSGAEEFMGKYKPITSATNSSATSA